jgi:hypothetical protein
MKREKRGNEGRGINNYQLTVRREKREKMRNEEGGMREEKGEMSN